MRFFTGIQVQYPLPLCERNLRVLEYLLKQINRPAVNVHREVFGTQFSSIYVSGIYKKGVYIKQVVAAQHIAAASICKYH